MSTRLRTRLALSLMGIVLPLLAIIVTVLSLWNSDEQLAAEERVLSRAQELNLSFLAMVDESRRVLASLIENPLPDWNRLKVYQNHFPYSKGIYLVSEEGQLLAPLEAGTPVTSAADRPWFRQALQTDDFIVGEFVVSRLTKIPALPLAQRFPIPKPNAAVLATSIDLAWFQKRMEERLPKGAVFTLVAPDGSVLVRFPDPGDYIGTIYPPRQALQVAAQGQTTTEQFLGLDKVVRLYATQPLILQGRFFGSLLVGVPISEVHQRSSTVQVVTWFAVALIFIVGFLLVSAQRKLALLPLNQMVVYTKALAEGDFSARFSSANLPEELSQLVRSINTMAEALESRDRELTTYRDHLEETVQQRTQDLEAAKAELLRSNAELQQFAYVASHDLQEPLRMVASFSQLLDQKYGAQLDGQGRQYLAFAVDGATRMQQLINDLLSFSRVDTQGHPFVVVAVSRCVAIAQANLQGLIEEKGGIVICEDLPGVMADPGQLNQLFQNLIANGLKFNRSATPTVRISARLRDDWAEFEVADNGIGIQPEFADRVFIIFQRLNSRAEYPGTGIGLALCKRIVERHGGRIWFDPAVGGGTRFFFTLPLAPK